MTETMDTQKLESVLTLAEDYVIRPTFDSSDVGSAICVLEDALHTALNNAPIWFADGNVKQWALCMNNAVQFREALYWLKNREVSFDAVQAERDKNSPQNIKGKLKDGLFPASMPDEVREIIKKWKVVSKSPYSDSFYDITNKSWGEDPDGFMRVADHWNFETRMDDGRVHAKTDKPVQNNKQWALGKYDADKGVYHIINIWDYEKDEDNSRFKAQMEARDKAFKKASVSTLNEIKDAPSKRVLSAFATLKNYVGLKSDVVSMGDSSANKAFESLCNKGIIKSGFTELIIKYIGEDVEMYPKYVTDFAIAHKRSQKVYWIEPAIQSVFKKRAKVNFDSVDESLFDMDVSDVVCFNSAQWFDVAIETMKDSFPNLTGFTKKGSLYNAELSHVVFDNTNAGVKKILDIIRNDDDYFAFFGLRATTKIHRVGEKLKNSFEWEDGRKTDRELKGVSTMKIKGDSEKDVISAIRNLGRDACEYFGVVDAPHHTYHGKNFVLVKGENATAGEDKGESVLENAVVMAVFNKDNVEYDSADLSTIERVKLLGEATALLQEKNATTEPLRKIQIAKRLSEIVALVYWESAQEVKPKRTEKQQKALQNPNSEIDVTNAIFEMMDSADSQEDKRRIYMLEQRLRGDFKVDANYKGYNADSVLQELTSKSLVGESNVQSKEELEAFVTNCNRRMDVLYRAEHEYSLLKVGAVESEMDAQEVQVKRIAESVLSGDDYLEYARLSDNYALFRSQYIKASENGENAREIQVEYMGETIKIELAIQILYAQRDKLYYKLKDEYVKKVKQSPMYLELKSEIEQMEREQYSVATSAIDALNNASGVTVEQANAWVESNTTVSKQAKSRLSKQGYTKEALEKDMADFYRLTGGKIGKVSIETNGARRAHTTGVMTEATAVINIDGDFSKKTLWHEMGHHLEKDPKASALAYSFIKKRRESDKIYSLNDLLKYKLGGYRSDEYAFKDSWIDPYVGKFYSKGTTEVFAMAMGWLSSPKECQKLISQDKELFDMVTGYLQTQRDDVCQFGLDILQAREDLKKAESVSVASKIEKLASEVEYKDISSFFGQEEIAVELARYKVRVHSKRGSKIVYLGGIEVDDKSYLLVSHATVKDYRISRKYLKKYVATWFYDDGSAGDNKYFDTELELKAWAKQMMDEKNANN